MDPMDMNSSQGHLYDIYEATTQTISVPVQLVLNTINESDASGGPVVTPTVSRRRQSHAFPTHHPHKHRRKVSAPPELKAHFGGVQHLQREKGVASPETADTSTSYVINLNPSAYNTNSCEGLYSGSDSGVPSEYSSWAIGSVSTRQRGNSTEDELASQSGSLDDDLRIIKSIKSSRKEIKYDSDTDIESLGSPQMPRRSTRAYSSYETSSPVSSADTGPPPLNRSYTDSNLLSTPPEYNRNRRNSLLLKVNISSASNNAVPSIHGGSNLSHTQSVSLMSLNGINQLSGSQQVAITGYPNLASLAAAETNSIYSEVGASGYNRVYLGNQSAATKVSDSQSSCLKITTPPLSHCPDDFSVEPQPTEPEKKKQWFEQSLSYNMSTIYAIFLFVLSMVIYLVDVFQGHSSGLAESFNIYLIAVQLLWLFYVHIDVRMYLKLISKTMHKSKINPCKVQEQVQFEPTGEGEYQLRINLPEPVNTIPQHYGFSSGKHGGSLYLKIGATIFCFGHLIHTGLNLGQKLLFLTSTDPAFAQCTCTADVLMSVLQPVYAFYQLFFIFKYSNLIINRRKLLAKFGLMHCISTSLCFWFYAILQETLQTLYLKDDKSSYGITHNITAASPIHATTAKASILGEEDDDSMEDDSYEAYNYKMNPVKLAFASSDIEFSYGCEKSTELTKMINLMTPYLYPFSIEYSILVVGIWILLLENLGKIERHTHIPSVEVTYEEDNSKEFSSNLIIYVDCHSSNRGLFAGLLMTVATVISIILFFIFTSSNDNKALGLLVNGYSELLILGIMTVTVISCFFTIRRLDVLMQKISKADDILLYICLPCIFLYNFLRILPSIAAGEAVLVIVAILQIIQVVTQTSFIVDGLRRCSNSSSLQQKKPGREIVTFLIVANVAMWLLDTFEIKSSEGNYNNYEFYGPVLWTLLSHVTLPLALFYRFHCSVCLSDMWKTCYEPEPEH